MNPWELRSETVRKKESSKILIWKSKQQMGNWKVRGCFPYIFLKFCISVYLFDILEIIEEYFHATGLEKKLWKSVMWDVEIAEGGRQGDQQSTGIL